MIHVLGFHILFDLLISKLGQHSLYPGKIQNISSHKLICTNASILIRRCWSLVQKRKKKVCSVRACESICVPNQYYY